MHRQVNASADCHHLHFFLLLSPVLETNRCIASSIKLHHSPPPLDRQQTRRPKLPVLPSSDYR